MILIVEDSMMDAQVYHEVLPPGIRVVTTGEAALEMMAQVGLDLISMLVLDLELPGMSGLKVLEAVRQRPEGRLVPAAFIASSMTPDQVRVAWELGATMVEEKPLALESWEMLGAQIQAHERHT